MIKGNANNTIVLFEPYIVDSKPVKNVPNNAPRLLILPTHDSSSVVSGPVVSGVLFDRRTGNADENQPILHPWARMT